MTAPLSRYLKDFSSPPPMPASPEPEDFGPAFSFELDPPEPAFDLDAERAAAFAEGKAAGEAEIRSAWEAEREARDLQHAKAQESLRTRLEGDAVLRLETMLRDTVERLADHVCQQVAPVLAPVLQEAVAATAIAELARSVKDALLAEKAAQITVRGPASLFEQFKEALGEDAPDLLHKEADDLDLAVELNDAVLVTRLSAWAGSLRKVLA
ncbi:hypothetical protein [Rhizobium sp. SL86]|uniref:hypothetical protein n=1 Tax=Rhizobium sp. SL86 TaxID=2995148 RepID=UPI0022725F32|nr:hypothetical protein [Rhizobium sp. SL86]MCY1664700.1 hypothetical protein [Rhizobium sp. SL86]